MQNFTLFAHGLVGGGKLGGPNSENAATFEHEPTMWGPTLTAGGGMDYDLAVLQSQVSVFACLRRTTATSTPTSARSRRFLPVVFSAAART